MAINFPSMTDGGLCCKLNEDLLILRKRTRVTAGEKRLGCGSPQILLGNIKKNLTN